VRRRLRRIRPDLVVGYRITSYGLLAAASGYRPLVLTTTGFDLLWSGGWTAWLRRALVRYAVGRADLVVSWADHMTDVLERSGRDGCPAEVLTIPRGIELDKFGPGAVAPGERPPVVLSTRSLKSWYRIDLLLQAFARVLPSRPDARLVLVGDGPERSNLERLARELGVDGATSFAGRVDYDDVGSYLADASVCASQIAFDGVSASLLEAMSSGVFPIVPDNPANRAWIRDGEGGFLVPYGDVEALAERLGRALSDPALRERAHAVNLELVRERGDRKRNMKRIESAFMRLAARGAGAG
jgi:glycosyltransferase involved in cell wall biosynthesis